MWNIGSMFKPSVDARLKSLSVNLGQENETRFQVEQNIPGVGTADVTAFAADLSRSDRTARVLITAQDDKATIQVTGSNGQVKGTGVGQLDLNVALTGNGEQLTITVTPTNGRTSDAKTYTLDLEQSYTSANLLEVNVNDVVVPIGHDYTVIGFERDQLLQIRADENAYVEILNSNGQLVDVRTQSVWAGRLPDLDLDQDNHFVIRLTPENEDPAGVKEYNLLLRPNGLAADLAAMEIRADEDLSVLSGKDYIALTPVSGSNTVYEASVGINERYLDFRFHAVNNGNNHSQGWPTVTTADGISVTALGNGEYRLDLENLSRVNEVHHTESHYKELYVPMFVETQYEDGKAYVMEYTLHIIRMAGDNSLRAIGLAPPNTLDEQLFDNDETAVKHNGQPKDGTLNLDGTTHMEYERAEDGTVTYKAYVDSTVTQLTVEAKATYVTALLSMGVGSAPAITESDVWYKAIPVTLDGEMTRVEIKVRAEMDVSLFDDDAVYYLEIYRVDDNADLKEVTSVHKDTQGVEIPNTAEKSTTDVDRYDLYISTSEFDADGLFVRDLALTATANRTLALVDMNGTDRNTSTAITANGTGEATLVLPLVRGRGAGEGDRLQQQGGSQPQQQGIHRGHPLGEPGAG